LEQVDRVHEIERTMTAEVHDLLDRWVLDLHGLIVLVYMIWKTMTGISEREGMLPMLCIIKVQEDGAKVVN
jgi:hypothetical protein